jgi:hypothetical protein
MHQGDPVWLGSSRAKATPLPRYADGAWLLDDRRKIVLVDGVTVALTLCGKAPRPDPPTDRFRISTGSTGCLADAEHRLQAYYYITM